MGETKCLRHSVADTFIACISGSVGDAYSPLRPYGALLCLGKVGKPSAPLSGPASRDSLAPALLRGSPQRAIPGPVRLTRHPCRAPHCAMPALGRPQVAIVSPIRSAHIHLPKIYFESGRKYRLKIRNADLLLLFRAQIWQTPPNARREAERRCRGVGRPAWMPVERRCARDGASARTHTTAPERGNPCEAGAGRQRRMVSSFAKTKDSTVRAKPQ